MPTAKKAAKKSPRKGAGSSRKSSSKKTSSAKSSAKKSAPRKKVQKVMHEYKEGDLHSRSKKGPKVKSRKQAIAIALSEAGVSRRSSKKTKKGKSSR